MSSSMTLNFIPPSEQFALNFSKLNNALLTFFLKHFEMRRREVLVHSFPIELILRRRFIFCSNEAVEYQWDSKKLSEVSRVIMIHKLNSLKNLHLGWPLNDEGSKLKRGKKKTIRRTGNSFWWCWNLLIVDVYWINIYFVISFERRPQQNESVKWRVLKRECSNCWQRNDFEPWRALWSWREEDGDGEIVGNRWS